MNKAKPDVKIFLDKERTLRFDLNAMVKFEEITGRNILNGAFSISGMSATDLRSMIYVCLSQDGDPLSIDQVGALISPDNMAVMAAKLNEAFEVASPPTPRTKRKSGLPLPPSPPGG
jgi:hypothetical protein